jgi:hypothetical protein
MKIWILYTLTVAFALYWVGNLILWFPWSINENLGIGLMFTIMPLLWGVGIYLCLIHYNGRNILIGSVLTTLIMVMSSVISDYIFFGLIRGAWNDLYKPTTFYGYVFLALIPFIERLSFQKLINIKKRQIRTNDFFLIGILGTVCFLTIIVIIKYDIKI